MKRLVIGGLFAVALAAAGQAADIPVSAPVYKAPAPAPAFSWTGCYVGGHVGGLFNDSDALAQPSVGYTAAVIAANTYRYGLNDNSITAGVQYGCNRQYGNVVLGLDSSDAWPGINQTVGGTNPVAPVPGNLPAPYSETITQKVSYYSTTRVRLGWAHDRWMAFIAGGLASGKVKSTYFLPAVAGFAYAGTDTNFRFGWTLGGGAEVALSENWFLRGEYLYVDLGRFSYASAAIPGAGSSWNTSVDTQFHVARVALSYRFTRQSSMIKWALGGFKY